VLTGPGIAGASARRVQIRGSETACGGRQLPFLGYKMSPAPRYKISLLPNLLS
jgi:hypothetical protein